MNNFIIFSLFVNFLVSNVTADQHEEKKSQTNPMQFFLGEDRNFAEKPNLDNVSPVEAKHQYDMSEALSKAQFNPPTEIEQIFHEEGGDNHNISLENNASHDDAQVNFLDMINQREQTATTLKNLEEAQDLEIDNIVKIQQTNPAEPLEAQGTKDYDAQINPLQKQFSEY